MKNVLLGLTVSMAAVTALGCRQASDESQVKQYEIHGKVVAVNSQTQTVTLDHEDIPGLMQGMEMEFKVDNAKVLEGIGPGDGVQGHLEVRGGDYVIIDLKRH